MKFVYVSYKRRISTDFQALRSAGPAINELANQSFLPHNGKAITRAMAVEALTKAYHLDSHSAKIFSLSAVAVNPEHRAHPL